jgi:uncharacterized protein YndB with AHSA1/START domain
VRFDEGPTVEVEVDVEGPPQAVWWAVTDIELPARFSEELQDAEWLDDDRAVGSRFTGRNRHPAAGEWQTTCTVIEFDEPRAFAYVVGDPDQPSATWRFTLEPRGPGTRLTHSVLLGPGPSGLTAAIASMPDKEERIIARRQDEHRENMTRTVEGIRALF